NNSRTRSPCYTWMSTSAAVVKAGLCSPVKELEQKPVITEIDVRKAYAPWIRIGEYKPGLLSHLSTMELARTLFVLRLCSLDSLVEKSPQLFEFAAKFGPLAKWPLRKTFFDQFVGGEDITRMTTVVQSLQKRGLRLMVAPVLEEDVNDQASSKNTYDNNLHSLTDLAHMCNSLEKKKALLQLKVSAIIPPKALEQAAKIITARSSDSQSLAKLVEELANTIENPSALTFDMDKQNKIFLIDGLKRADTLVNLARQLSILMVVDAEFFSCQPAIAAIALALMTRYNQHDYLVGNTIQGYLKSAVTTTESELEVTKLIGVNWYGKIVRGAYMDRERKIASSQSIPSPICDSYDESSISYNRCVQLVLEHIALTKNKTKSHLLVASHNETSIRLAAQGMKDLQIQNDEDRVSFAQIYGMAEYLSTPLVEKGYTVYKSTPYGPMEKVMPYLSRRAFENRSVILGAREEKNMLRKELQSRVGLSRT
ncbi:unnamed protein product, partial [Allacma fusca]